MKADFNILHLLWAIRNIPSTQLNPQEKLILYTMLSCANEYNDSWHGYDRLSELTSLGRTTVIKYIKTLAKKNYIILTRPPVYNRSSSNHYALNLDTILYYSKVSLDDTISQKRCRQTTVKVSPRELERCRGANSKKEREELKEEGRAQSSSEDEPRPSTEDFEAWARQLERMNRKEIPFDYELFGGAQIGMAKKYTH
jgi:hypothetical protein